MKQPTQPIHTSGPLRIAMESTCSAAWPVIVEDCLDPETGAPWEFEVCRLPTTHVERRDLRGQPEPGEVGTFNAKPERFCLQDGAPEIFANAAMLRTAPDMVIALGMVLQSFAYAPGTGPLWFEACRQAHADATTPYTPVPDPTRT